MARLGRPRTRPPVHRLTVCIPESLMRAVDAARGSRSYRVVLEEALRGAVHERLGTLAVETQADSDLASVDALRAAVRELAARVVELEGSVAALEDATAPTVGDVEGVE